MLEDIDYLSNLDDEAAQKVVTFEVENPEHPHNWSFEHLDTAYPGLREEMFEASQWAVRKLGKERNLLVAHFILAVKRMEEEGDESELVYLVQTLTER